LNSWRESQLFTTRERAALAWAEALTHIAKSLGLERGLAFIDSAAAGVDPNLLGIGPVASTRKLLKRQPGLSLPDINAIEFNEAFAAQVLASL
ncbi:hypothetical protein ACC861_37540, partial [Rhizobium ruizarguesonis]